MIYFRPRDGGVVGLCFWNRSGMAVCTSFAIIIAYPDGKCKGCNKKCRETENDYHAERRSLIFSTASGGESTCMAEPKDMSLSMISGRSNV